MYELAERSYEFNGLDSFVRRQGEGKLSTEETSRRIVVALQSFQRLISNLSLYGLFQGSTSSVAGEKTDTETLDLPPNNPPGIFKEHNFYYLYFK